MPTKEKLDAIIRQHESGGKYITVEDVKTFYLDAGSGPSSFVCPSCTYVFLFCTAK